jgi:hypothetical protein
MLNDKNGNSNFLGIWGINQKVLPAIERMIINTKKDPKTWIQSSPIFDSSAA